jgi:UDP-GlcNAc:undecaprenyl-phosphate GlcNAc-1-phosphate transferase
MRLVIFCLIAVSFAISWLVTRWMKSFAVAIGFVDRPGGRKAHDNPKPLGGGIGIFWGLAIPVLAGLGYVTFAGPPGFLRQAVPGQIDAYWSGARMQTHLAWEILLAGAGIHVLGLWDDRKSLGPFFKLLVQLFIVAALVLAANLRILTFLDHAMPY